MEKLLIESSVFYDSTKKDQSILEERLICKTNYEYPELVVVWKLAVNIRDTKLDHTPLGVRKLGQTTLLTVHQSRVTLNLKLPVHVYRTAVITIVSTVKTSTEPLTISNNVFIDVLQQ